MSKEPNGMLARAIGSAFVIPFAAGMLIWPYGTMVLTVVLIMLAAREGAQIVGAIMGGASPHWTAALLILPLLALALSPAAALASLVLILLALTAVQLVGALRVTRGSVAPQARFLFGTIATTAWLSPLLLLPLFGVLGARTPAPWIAWILAVVWSADTGAFIIGRRFGKRKLAPIISPKKSVEGLLGGTLLATVVGSATAGLWLDAPLAWALPASAAVAAAAEAGDLVESLFKRSAGVKSSARLIPGHGGVLDRIDSLLIAAPVALLAALVLQILPMFTLGS
jgi:phosphatidate cytidylyltransferase